MSLALMPDLEPAPPRAPEQLVFRAAPFVELLFPPPARARAACRSERPRGATSARVASEADDLLTWRPRARRARPARAQAVGLAAQAHPAEFRVSRPAPRARVIAPKPLTHEERVELAQIERELRGPAFRGLPVVRPERRSGCANVPRPCPFASCADNLYLDVLPSGSIKRNFPHLDILEMDPKLSCSRDVAAREGVALEVVGAALNVSMERIRQILEVALAKGATAVRPEDVEFETKP